MRAGGTRIRRCAAQLGLAAFATWLAALPAQAQKVQTVAEHLGHSSIIHLRVVGIDTLLGAKFGAGNQRVDAGQCVGPAPDAAWALAFDAEHQRAA